MALSARAKIKTGGNGVSGVVGGDLDAPPPTKKGGAIVGERLFELGPYQGERNWVWATTRNSSKGELLRATGVAVPPLGDDFRGAQC